MDEQRLGATSTLELLARISRALMIDPADHATTSRDYGRGFADATRLFHQALTDPSPLFDRKTET